MNKQIQVNYLITATDFILFYIYVCVCVCVHRFWMWLFNCILFFLCILIQFNHLCDLVNSLRLVKKRNLYPKDEMEQNVEQKMDPNWSFSPNHFEHLVSAKLL